MSFLAPLYALAGLAIAIPLLLHLVRKQPKKHQVFSSLMFLEATTPRLTSARRIDQLLLLLLRSAAILLLALAFSRPYWNVAATHENQRTGVSRMLLLDVSASMRREGAWESLQEKANQIIDESGPTDSLSIYSYDQSLKPLLSIDEAIDTPLAQRKEKSRIATKAASPGWMATDLGLALTTAADLLQSDRGAATEAPLNVSEIVVITDFQQGTNLEKLADHSWPESIKVRLERVAPKSSSNARANVVVNKQTAITPTDRIKDDKSLRVFVSSESSSDNNVASGNESTRNETLELAWLDANGRPIESTRTAAPVPAQSNLIVSIPPPPVESTTLRLSGDKATFDNDYFIAPIVQSEFSLVCIDDSKRLPEDSLAYFLKQIPLGSLNRKVTFIDREPESVLPWPSSTETPLIVASHRASLKDLQALNAFLAQGGHVLWVWDTAENEKSFGFAQGLEALTKNESKSFGGQVSEAKVRQYSMLEQVDFRHPLFADLADSKFNDYSKIRFWSHRKLELSEPDAWQVLARFDDHSPALLSRKQTAGTLWLMTAGWQPSQSQFALSSKFVPLIAGLFRIASPPVSNDSTRTVGEVVEWLPGERIVDPNGQLLVTNNPEPIVLSTGDSEPTAIATGDAKINVAIDGKTKPEANADGTGGESLSSILTQPGLYTRYDVDQKPFRFAVNLNDAESQTAPAGLDRLDQYGVLVHDGLLASQNAVAGNQLRAVELESRQGWWQWLVMGVLAAIGLESILCIGKGF